MIDSSPFNEMLLITGLTIVAGTSAWLAAIDWRTHRLPDRITLPLSFVVGLWVGLLGFTTGDLARSVAAFAWGVAGFSVFLVLSFAGMGGGDVKFAAPLAATLGWFGGSAVSAGLFAMVTSASFTAIIALAQRKGSHRHIAFGPHMAFGVLCGIAQGLLGAN